MTELKTLKDLVDLSDNGYSVNTELLKAEAVKWVTDLDVDIFQRKGSKMLSKNEISCLISTSEWIKHFFNLTEADIK